jgi:hypothetical protein
LLRRREFVVEDDQAAFLGAGEGGDLLHLARADEVAGAFFPDLGDQLIFAGLGGLRHGVP